MPLTVVVGGQFGSEGKGKVSQLLAQIEGAVGVVRTGGTNSGHTGIAADGSLRALRQLPTAALLADVACLLPPGSIIDPEIFVAEVKGYGLSPERVKVHPWSTVISAEDKATEHTSGLVKTIGSTGSGTGAAIQRRISRLTDNKPILASGHNVLHPFLSDTTTHIRAALKEDKLIVIEGTQGFGLSIFHGGYFPHATSRDTTAAGFVAEAGLSPRDVSDIVLVIRSFPIRVAGSSGPLKNEISWNELAIEAGLPETHQELTTATGRIRRVGRFDGEVVRRAIEINQPTRIVLNHLDYVDASITSGPVTSKARAFIDFVEGEIGANIDFIGIDGRTLRSRHELDTQKPSALDGKVLIPATSQEAGNPGLQHRKEFRHRYNKKYPARPSSEKQWDYSCIPKQ